jgi:hypothetical protein
MVSLNNDSAFTDIKITNVLQAVRQKGVYYVH